MKKYMCGYEIRLEVVPKYDDQGFNLMPKDEVVILNSREEIHNFLEEQSEIEKKIKTGIEKYVWKNFKKRITVRSNMSMVTYREMEA